jgi:hypothetical protein
MQRTGQIEVALTYFKLLHWNLLETRAKSLENPKSNRRYPILEQSCPMPLNLVQSHCLMELMHGIRLYGIHYMLPHLNCVVIKK